MTLLSNKFVNTGGRQRRASGDRIREQLQQMGITSLDRPNGDTSYVSIF